MKIRSSNIAAQQSRANARREQIVAASEVCFRQHGFRGASMGDIAQQASMSVGQIYRYFLNKETIIEAIVEKIVTDRLAWIETTGGTSDLAAMLAQHTATSAKAALNDDAALLMEAHAEAARNPAVAKIVRAADRKLHERAAAMVKQDYPEWSSDEIAARVEVMAVISEGTAFRAITKKFADTDTLEALYRNLIGQLLPPRPDQPGALARAPSPGPKKTANKSRLRQPI